MPRRVLADLKAAWQAGSADNIGIVAAGIAHYALLALVPALGSLVLAYGLFADAATVASHITLISAQLPPSAAELITDQLESVAQGSSGAQGAGLLVALAIALFGARNGARSLMTGLNIAFGVDGMRGFLGGNLMALAITAAGIAGLVLTAATSAALANIAGMFGSIASFLLLLGVAALAAGLLYRFAPHAPAPAWAAIGPGACFFAVTWLAATAAFGFYAANFGSYNATYGALGAVVALITWFWATGFLLLLGGELTALRNRRS